MAYTQAQVDALKAAVAKGATRLKMNGEEVQFGSLAEMRRQISVMEAELAGGSKGQMSVSFPVTMRGL
ncbi:phage head-tail joining protein [Thalassovita sp.]|uniref:phage head-tail joining protein n=1 Tax=Thalassovita sp. TaxID=1979401 RepID=UPI0028823D7C|nr:hypothetical protein [Thalassovita sp.]MDF1801718.1 hypothetical protein [Thalassovita sp.]